MEIAGLQQIYAKHPNVGALVKLLQNQDIRTVFMEGTHASCASFFASAFIKQYSRVNLFILNDLEEAGYFYHDMVQADGDEEILFFPSSFRRAIKYGQRDAANEILRTEVLARLKQEKPVTVVTYPDALAEKVVSQKSLDERMLCLRIGQHIDTEVITGELVKYGFHRVDYVYEPGQFAMRGSILDVYSFASEYPYRIDFFGDEIDSIRTFEVDSQLSKEKKDAVSIVPELSEASDGDVCLLEFVPETCVLWVKDLMWVRERIQAVHDEVFSPQAVQAYEGEETDWVNLRKKLISGPDFLQKALSFRRIDFGHKAAGTPQATLAFQTSIQPIFHKNFDLVASTLTDYRQRGYQLYICSDSVKQTDRLRDIFQERGDCTKVSSTIH